MYNDFRTALYDAGYNPPSTIRFDWRIQRFGKDKTQWLVSNGEFGVAGDWRSQLPRVRWHKNTERSLSNAERLMAFARWKEAEAIAKREYEAEQRQKQLLALKLWTTARSAGHAYCIRKQIQSHGTKVIDADTARELGAVFAASITGDLVVVPLCDFGRVLRGLQLISEDGQKRFLGSVKKLFCRVGKFTDNLPIIGVAEGFATAASIYEATGFPMLATMSAHNMESLAPLAKANWPKSRFVICADADEAGQKAAQAAAKATGGIIATPTFNHHQEEKPATDWNDLKCAESLAAVRTQILQAVQVSSTND